MELLALTKKFRSGSFFSQPTNGFVQIIPSFRFVVGANLPCKWSFLVCIFWVCLLVFGCHLPFLLNLLPNGQDCSYNLWVLKCVLFNPCPQTKPLLLKLWPPFINQNPHIKILPKSQFGNVWKVFANFGDAFVFYPNFSLYRFFINMALIYSLVVFSHFGLTLFMHSNSLFGIVRFILKVCKWAEMTPNEHFSIIFLCLREIWCDI